MNEIEKFDPSTLMQGVRDRIKSTFVSLIPDLQWEQLCKKEIDDFFKQRDDYRSQRDWRTMSDFQKICFQEFEDLTKAKIREMMQVYVSNMWENNQPKLNEELGKAIAENANEIFTKMFAGMFQSAVNQMSRGY